MDDTDEANDKNRRFHHPSQISEKMKLLLILCFVVTIFFLVLLPAAMPFLSLLKPLIVKRSWEALRFLAITTAIFVCIMPTTFFPIGNTSEETFQERVADNSRSNAASGSRSDSGVPARNHVGTGKKSSNSGTHRSQREQNYHRDWTPYPNDDGFSFDVNSRNSSPRLQNEKEKIVAAKVPAKKNPIVSGNEMDPNTEVTTSQPMIIEEDPIHESGKMGKPKHVKAKVSAQPKHVKAKVSAQPQAIDKMNKQNRLVSSIDKDKPQKAKAMSHQNISTDYPGFELIGTSGLLQPTDEKMTSLITSSRLRQDDPTFVRQGGNIQLGGSDRSSSLLGSTKHSISALNLAELDELINGKANRSKTSRRKTSQSCDFHDEEWTFKEPPPPPELFLQRIEDCTCEMGLDCPHRPYSTFEDLVPWRRNTSDSDFGNMSKQAEFEDITDSASCILLPRNGTSPQLFRSPSELNRKASEFIDKVYSNFLRERQLSFEQRKKTPP